MFCLLSGKEEGGTVAVTGLDKPEFRQYDLRWRAAVTVAIVAAIFTLIVCIVLISNYLLLISNDPLDNPELLRLRERLAESPGENETLAKQIQAMDMLARKAFFSSQAQLETGGILLLGGAVVMLIAFNLCIMMIKHFLPLVIVIHNLLY